VIKRLSCEKMRKFVGRLLCQIPVLDFYFIASNKINTYFPMFSYMSRKKKVLAQLEHVAYLILGFYACLMLNAKLAFLIYASCALIVMPLEAYLAKKVKKFPTWEWASKHSFKTVFSTFCLILVNLTLYFSIGVLVAHTLYKA